MSDKKIIIRNCPAYSDYCEEIKSYECQDCTNCVMKRIVELCKHIKSINKTNSYIGEYSEFTQHSPLANEILELLDIQEVE